MTTKRTHLFAILLTSVIVSVLIIFSVFKWLSSSTTPTTNSPDATLAQDSLQGKLMFLTSCAKCHGNFGEGVPNSGPKLTDQEWRHGNGSVRAVETIITEGLPGTQMMGWKHKMQAKDIRILAQFVVDLGKSSPPPFAPKLK